MTPETGAKSPRAGEVDLDAEREVDLGRYLDALVARWWLPLLGLAVGIVLGYALALGGKDVYRAQATVYVGSPYAPNGSSALPSTITTNQNAISRIVRSESTIEAVSRESGMSRAKLRAGISISQVRSGLGRLVPSQLYTVSVKGDRRVEVAAAASALANRIVEDVGGYARAKITGLKAQRSSQNQQLEAIDRQVAETQAALDRGVSSTERLALLTLLSISEQRRGTLEQNRIQITQLLALAREVELPGVIGRPVATETTARSARNSAAVAGLIGLVLGILAALLWEPVAARTGRTE